ncbi:MAG: hypothetical protein GOVbin703_140 [Prokaryotic dsDNA virus sp.]|nr:MAG: hypothetical protein GOVbin703_140 [Prokaryotic dsDNA virus sp.]|tara:strand:+ start:353 stop:538 length:186 start_codon:yes stop_codon:yes gene_type:complete
MKFIRDFLHNREVSKIRKRISKLQEKALHWQRNGNLREYAVVVSQLEELTDYLVEKIREKE